MAALIAALSWRPRPSTRRIPPPLLIAVNGVLIAASLAALIGLWTR